MEEIFKEVKGYEGLYEISNIGRLKSLPRFTTRGGILKTSITQGYVVCGLWKEGNGKMIKLHRLVAQEFIPNPNNYCQVNHINGIKSDNRVENLEWVTAVENSTHRDKRIKNKKSKYNGVSYLSYKDNKYWTAYCTKDKKSIHLGCFKTEEEAYKAKLKFMEENKIINKYA